MFVMIGRFSLCLAALSYGSFAAAQLANPAPPAAQAPAPAKKTLLKPSEYKNLDSIVDADISKDGRWSRYMLVPVDGITRLEIRKNDEATTYTIPNGAAARFSDDSRYAAYMIVPPREVAERLRAERKPVISKLGIRELASGTEVQIEAVASFQILKGGKTLIARRTPTEGDPESRADLTIVDLATLRRTAITNVSDYAANEKEDALALEVIGGNGERGVQTYEISTGAMRTVYWSKDDIAGLTWAKDVDTLAFMAGTAKDSKVGVPYRVLVSKNPRDLAPTVVTYSTEKDAGIPKDHRIAEFRGLSLNDAGTRIAFGVQAWKDKPTPKKPTEFPDVEVWNAKDVDLVSQQKVQANAIKAQTKLVIWTVGAEKARIVQDDLRDGVSPIGDFSKVIVSTERPYETAVTSGWTYQDVNLVDSETGAVTSVLKKVHFGIVPSREGKFLAYFQDKRWKLYDIAKAQHIDFAATSKANFEDTLVDYIVPEKPPVDTPTWFANDEAVVVRDEFDVYLYRPATKAFEKITNGRGDSISSDVLDIRRDPDGMKITDPIFFSQFNRKTKASGFAVRSTSGQFKTLAMDEKLLTSLRQATETDRVLFVMGSFAESPNIYVTNTAFSAIKPITKTNPQLKDALWGKSVLVNYKSRWGVELQGILMYPADYSPDRRYPMVTYIYERLSDDLHRFVRPIEFSSYNEQIFAQNGYFVFKPDIAYRESSPGQDAVDCLEPAVQAVLKLRAGVDPDRLGLMGHSWGGYQTAFVTTVSKLFKVGVAGAPLTELTSMYNMNYGNAGIANQIIFETSQGRFAKPFWEMPKNYLDNSPIWQAKNRTAPLLMTFGDADGAVDWKQGLMFYNTLRRQGKPCVMLLYPGENHNFTRRPNQLDYGKRLRHFMDVYLKGAKPETWITDGVPFTPLADR